MSSSVYWVGFSLGLYLREGRPGLREGAFGRERVEGGFRALRRAVRGSICSSSSAVVERGIGAVEGGDGIRSKGVVSLSSLGRAGVSGFVSSWS